MYKHDTISLATTMIIRAAILYPVFQLSIKFDTRGLYFDCWIIIKSINEIVSNLLSHSVMNGKCQRLAVRDIDDEFVALDSFK